MTQRNSPPSPPSFWKAAAASLALTALAYSLWPGSGGDILLQGIAALCALAALKGGLQSLHLAIEEARQLRAFIRSKQRGTERGSAGWMSRAEARNLKLHKRHKGARFLGTLQDLALFAKTETHHLIIGPAGSAKSTSAILPQLMMLTESLLVSDIKKELFEQTAEFRRTMLGQRIVLFDPFDPKTACFNPLDRVKALLDAGSPKAISYVGGLALQLHPDPLRKDQNQHFRDGTRLMIVAIVLAVARIAPSEHHTLATVLRALTDMDFLHGLLEEAVQSDALNGALAEMATNQHTQAFGDGEAGRNFEQFRIGAYMALESFGKGGALEHITSKTTFDFADLKSEKVTCYISIDYASKDALSALPGMLQWAAVQDLVAARNNKPVTLILDEFCNSPLHSLPTILTLLRSYGVKCMMATQDLDDITRVYGNHARESIISESDIAQFLGGIRSQTTLEFLAKRLGDYTETAPGFSFGKDGIQTSASRINRAVMTTDELRRLDKAQQIIFFANHKPILAQKVPIFAMAPFRQQITPNSMYGGKRYLLPVRVRITRSGAKVTWRGRTRMRRQNPAMLIPVLWYIFRRLISGPGFVLLLVLALVIAQIGLPYLRISYTYQGSGAYRNITSCSYLGPTRLGKRAQCPPVLFHKPWSH